jgi:hypothetical protein
MNPFSQSGPAVDGRDTDHRWGKKNPALIEYLLYAGYCTRYFGYRI